MAEIIFVCLKIGENAACLHSDKNDLAEKNTDVLKEIEESYYYWYGNVTA